MRVSPQRITLVSRVDGVTGKVGGHKRNILAMFSR